MNKIFRMKVGISCKIKTHKSLRHDSAEYNLIPDESW